MFGKRRTVKGKRNMGLLLKIAKLKTGNSGLRIPIFHTTYPTSNTWRIMMLMYDLQSLQDALGTNVTDSVTSGIQSQIDKIIAWIVVPSIILTLLVLLLYVLHMLRRRKIENAILEIRDTLRDIKLAQVAPAKPAYPADTLKPAEKPDVPESATPLQPS